MFGLLFRKRPKNNEVRVRKVVEVSRYGEPDPLYVVERYLQGYGWKFICSTCISERADELRDIWEEFLAKEGSKHVV